MFNKFFKKKEEKLPIEAQIYLLAVSTLQNGEYQKSLELFNKYISEYMNDGGNIADSELAEQNAQIYYNRSIAKEALNDKAGAILDLKKSVQLFEIHQAYFRLADLQSQTGEQQESIKNLVRAYELGSSDAEQALRKYTNYFNR